MSKLRKVSPKRALACLLALFALLTVFAALAEGDQAAAEAPAAADFGLAEAAIYAASSAAPGRPLAIQPDYAPPAEDDIAFESADEGMAGVQLDGGLRF